MVYLFLQIHFSVAFSVIQRAPQRYSKPGTVNPSVGLFSFQLTHGSRIFKVLSTNWNSEKLR